jgi:hypothetical protein
LTENASSGETPTTRRRGTAFLYEPDTVNASGVGPLLAREIRANSLTVTAYVPSGGPDAGFDIKSHRKWSGVLQKNQTFDVFVVSTPADDSVYGEIDAGPPVFSWPSSAEKASSETNRVAYVVTSPNATAATEDFALATMALRSAFAAAASRLSERFDRKDDIYQCLTDEVEAILRRFGQLAFDIAGRIVLLEGPAPGIALSALRAAGYVNDPTIRETRRTLARNALKSKVPELRYGALHVFAGLGERASATEVAEAAEREPISRLRSDMERLIGILTR